MAEEWHRALRCYPTAVIERAFTSIIASKTFWPVVAEVIKACESIQIMDFQRADDERKARQAAEDARHIPDPFESFRQSALGFIKSRESIEQEFRAAGVTTLHGEIGLYFESVEAAHRIARLYGEQLDAHLGYHVPIDLEPAPTPTTRVIRQKWEKAKQ